MKYGILFLIDRLGIGGTEKQLFELIRHLDRNRFEPHLCTLYSCDESGMAPVVIGCCLGFRAFYQPGALRVITKLTRYIRQNHIRIVQSFFQDSTLIAALSRPLHKARLIGSFRDLGFWRNRKETFKMRLAYKAFNGFIANSKSVKAHFVETDNIDP